MIGVVKQILEIDYFLEKSPLPLLAPTSVGTFNISSSTVNFMIHIPNKDMTYLESSHLINLQRNMQHVKYILIDEMSFIWTSLYLSFGGRLIILVNDLGQLPSVINKFVYACEGWGK